MINFFKMQYSTLIQQATQSDHSFLDNLLADRSHADHTTLDTARDHHYNRDNSFQSDDSDMLHSAPQNYHGPDSGIEDDRLVPYIIVLISL